MKSTGGRKAMTLPRGEPEALGVSSRRLLEFVETVDREIDSLHSLVLVRHGRVVAEGTWKPYEAGTPHMLWSLTKSFTAMAVGLAIAEGRFRLEDPILKHFPEEAPSRPSAHLKAMRVRHLLTMNTGHKIEPPCHDWGRTWKRTFFSHPVLCRPGTRFVYNTPASGILAALVEKTTGRVLSEYLRPRLFEPLGIQNPRWMRDGNGASFGGFGLFLRTAEIARFGQFLLQKGSWKGKQLVPRAWVEAATSFQTKNGDGATNEWGQGYGYQFWMCRYGGYRADGAFGQLCIVMPGQDAVLAVTSGTPDMGKVMGLTWNKLLSALAGSPLPADRVGCAALARALARLSLRPLASAARPTAGLLNRTYFFLANPRKFDQLRIGSGKRGATVMIVRREGKDYRLDFGNKTWIQGLAPWWDDQPRPLAASGGWIAPGVFSARICRLDGMYVHAVRLVFSAGALKLSDEAKVGFGQGLFPDLVGVASLK